ncbi:MAG: LptF/LptG family permease [candidate division WOR-3 bacterium]|nr:MAG: LptF/LptG family permease [candidate division WOR-3 bacterium]
MSIINRYVLKQFIRYGIICLGVAIFIYIVINLFDNLGKFLAKNATAVDIMLYYVYLVPSYAILLVPVASMIAVFLVFGIMTKNRELLVLKTCGFSINSLFYLLLIAGGVIAAGTFVFQETVGVWAQARLIQHEQEQINRRPQRPNLWRRNFFYYGEDNWIYFIRKFDGRINTMDDIIMWQTTRDNRIKKRIDAPHGRFDGIWVFENATVRQFDTLDIETVTRHAILKMPGLVETPVDFIKKIKPVEEMNFLEISAFVRKRQRAGQDVAKEKVELNYRFSYPIITLVLLLITLPISIVLRRGGIAVGLGISIGLSFTYWGFIQSSRAYGVAGILSPFLAAWLPNIVFGIIGIILFLKAPR